MRELKSVAEACKRVNARRMRGAAIRRPPNWSLAAGACLQSMPSLSSTYHGGSNVAQRLLAWLDPREDEMAALLTELVSVPTENPPGRNYRVCADLLEKRLCQAGLTCKRHDFPSLSTGVDDGNEPAASLMASFGNGKRTLYFHGHYDVVPAQSPEQFQPVRKEHFLFGRGSCDMKGGIVLVIAPAQRRSVRENTAC